MLDLFNTLLTTNLSSPVPVSYDSDSISPSLPLSLLSFLDLDLPLWLGGAPSPSPAHVSSTSITACVRQVLVNGRLLDLNSHIDQRNSQPGYPQVLYIDSPVLFHIHPLKPLRIMVAIFTCASHISLNRFSRT